MCSSEGLQRTMMRYCVKLTDNVSLKGAQWTAIKPFSSNWLSKATQDSNESDHFLWPWYERTALWDSQDCLKLKRDKQDDVSAPERTSFWEGLVCYTSSCLMKNIETVSGFVLLCWTIKKRLLKGWYRIHQGRVAPHPRGNAATIHYGHISYNCWTNMQVKMLYSA